MFIKRIVFASFLLLAACTLSHAQNCIDLGGANPLIYTQNFDGLGVSPAPQNGDPLNVQVLNPAAPRRYLGKFDNAIADNASVVNVPGWAVVEEGTNASSVTGRYNVGNGSATGGNTYSFGTDPDRSLGSLNDNTVAVNYLGGCFRNTSVFPILSVTVAFTGEMWRRGAAGIQTDRLDFEYAVNAANLYSGSFIANNSFDFVTPNTSGAAGARDGNNASFRTVVPASSMAVTLAPGATLHVRWIDSDIAVQDDGLAIDDFTINFLVPSAADVSISGRVQTANGRSISKAVLTLTDQSGVSRRTMTNLFGYYSFFDVSAGRSYILSVASKGVHFETSSVVLQPVESLEGIDFIAMPR